MKKEFSNAELADILGRNSRFVIDWTERGIIIADLAEAAGPGSKRLYSFGGVLRAALGVHLKDRHGMARHTLKSLLDHLWEKGFFKDWASGFIVSRKARYDRDVECFSKNPLPDGLEPVPPTPELGAGSLLIFFTTNGDIFHSASELRLSDVLKVHLSQDIEKNGTILSDLIAVNLQPIKDKVVTWMLSH